MSRSKRTSFGTRFSRSSFGCVCARVCVENCRESTSMKGKVGLCSLVKLVIHRVCCSVVMVGYCRREGSN